MKGFEVLIKEEMPTFPNDPNKPLHQPPPHPPSAYFGYYPGQVSNHNAYFQSDYNPGFPHPQFTDHATWSNNVYMAAAQAQAQAHAHNHPHPSTGSHHPQIKTECNDWSSPYTSHPFFNGGGAISPNVPTHHSYPHQEQHPPLTPSPCPQRAGLATGESIDNVCMSPQESPYLKMTDISDSTDSQNTILAETPTNDSPDRPSSCKASYDWMKKSGYGPQSEQDNFEVVQHAPKEGKTRTRDKYRVVYSDHQRLELEKEFHFSRYITIKRKTEMASTLGLSERQVKIWFQNRRAKERKLQKKRDEVTIKPTGPEMDMSMMRIPYPPQHMSY